MNRLGSPISKMFASRGPMLTALVSGPMTQGMDASASSHIWRCRSRPNPSMHWKVGSVDNLSVDKDVLYCRSSDPPGNAERREVVYPSMTSDTI